MPNATLGAIDVTGAWAKAPDALNLPTGDPVVLQNLGQDHCLLAVTSTPTGPTSTDHPCCYTGRSWSVTVEDGEALWTRTVPDNGTSRLIAVRGE